MSQNISWPIKLILGLRFPKAPKLKTLIIAEKTKAEVHLGNKTESKVDFDSTKAVIKKRAPTLYLSIWVSRPCFIVQW